MTAQAAVPLNLPAPQGRQFYRDEPIALKHRQELSSPWLDAGSPGSHVAIMGHISLEEDGTELPSLILNADYL